MNHIEELPIKTDITSDDQKYVDEPVYAEPTKRFFTALAVAMAREFGHYARDFSGRVFRTDIPPKILLKYNRVILRWMKPDGNGGLVPKY